MLTSFTSASKPAAVLPRLHSSAIASTTRTPQQSRGFRLVVKSPYYHRVSISANRDIDILNRRLVLSGQAGIPNSFGRVAGIAGTVVCEKKSTVDVDLQKLKHDSNRAAVYLARTTTTTTFTSYKPKGYDQPRSSQSYIAERNASHRIPRNGPPRAQKSDNFEQAIPVRKFSGYHSQFEAFKPPVVPVSKKSGNILFNRSPPSAPLNSAPYVTDSELYLDGKTLEQELKGYYKAVKHNEPDGSPVDAPCPVREALKEYDASPECNYHGFAYNEPDGKPPAEPCPVEDGLSEYDQTAKYDGAKPFTFNEPDGLPIEPVCEVESALNEYDQKATYDGAKPFTFNEPDGLPIEPVSEVETALSDYDQNATYNGSKPFTFNEPDGLPIEPVSEVETGLNDYDQTAKYDGAKPFTFNEPDGLPVEPTSEVETALNDYDEKATYDGSNPFTFNEPDGLPAEPVSEVETALNDYDQKATYDGPKPFTFNEPDGLPIEEPSEVESALNEYDMRPEANGYKAFAHNEPNGQQPQHPDKVGAALNEYDQKWEPKIENDNFFFDEDFRNELENIAAAAPHVAGKNATTASTTSPLKTEAELVGAVPIRKIKTSAGFIKGRKETADEKKVRRSKLESDFDKSSAQFVRDIEAVRKSDKIRHSRKQLEQFEIEASVLLNQYHHLRGKIDDRLEELAAEDKKAESKKAGGSRRGEVSTGGAAFSDTIESTTPFPFKSGIDVRREEEVLSGGKGERRWEKRQRRGGKVKRVLGGAVAGAGVFYAAGVVSEFFTTGGSEGTGAVGL